MLSDEGSGRSGGALRQRWTSREGRSSRGMSVLEKCGQKEASETIGEKWRRSGSGVTSRRARNRTSSLAEFARDASTSVCQAAALSMSAATKQQRGIGRGRSFRFRPSSRVSSEPQAREGCTTSRSIPDERAWFGSALLLLRNKEVRKVLDVHLLERRLVADEREDPARVYERRVSNELVRMKRERGMRKTHLSTWAPSKCGRMWRSNLALRSGVPSSRRRLCPTGVSMCTSGRTVPSLSVTVSAFEMKRLFGSW